MLEWEEEILSNKVYYKSQGFMGIYEVYSTPKNQKYWTACYSSEVGIRTLGRKHNTPEEAKAACETHAAEQLRLHQEWAGVPDYHNAIQQHLKYMVLYTDDNRTCIDLQDHDNKFHVLWNDPDDYDRLKDKGAYTTFDEALAAALELVENEDE
jgi:hypothetical protein